ncbi:MAG: tRNA (adenosine(37)-N6)-dimethylallyltransferase MiaA, partial [Planctomycetota bacterium]
MKPPLRILLGPTASGKERLALCLAERAGAEIVSVDSMKIYRRMDIGTAKPGPRALARVRHWCVDIVDPWEGFSVAEYLARAEAALADIESRGKRHILSGGTALYYKALTEGLFDGPSADEALRRSLLEEARAKGAGALHERLSALDPRAAEKIHPNDLRRIVRALEVVARSGRRLSDQQTQFGRLRADRGVA